MNSIFTLLLPFDWLRQWVAVLSLVAASSIPLNVDKPKMGHESMPQNVLLFLECHTQSCDVPDGDLQIIRDRLATWHFESAVVWRDQYKVVIHASGPAGQARWNKAQFLPMLLSGKMFIGETDESDEWKQTIFKGGMYPEGIVLSSMNPFRLPALISTSKARLRAQFPQLEAAGYSPYVHCDDISGQCALQVLKRRHLIPSESTGHVEVGCTDAWHTPVLDVEMMDLNTLQGDAELFSDIIEMEKATLVMDGEAVGVPADFVVKSETRLRVEFDQPDGSFSDDTIPPSRLRLMLSVFAGGEPLANQWKLIHVQPVQTRVGATSLETSVNSTERTANESVGGLPDGIARHRSARTQAAMSAGIGQHPGSCGN